MRQEIGNRIVFVLACAGLFVSLVLAIAHSWGAQLPCGAGNDCCNKVADSPINKVTGIPVAYYGVGAYLFLILASLTRAVLGVGRSQRTGFAMWVIAAVGTLASIGLTIYSSSELGCFCPWCLASAGIMVLLFLVLAFSMMGAPIDRASHWSWRVYLLGFLISAIAGSVYGGYVAQSSRKETFGKKIEIQKDAQLFYDRHYIYGNKDAPITIIEFSDLYCPSCRSNHAWLKSLIDGPLSGKVKLVIRHFPITNKHPMALSAAILAEWAGSKGKFHQFVDRAMAIPDETDVILLMQAVEEVGLDPQEASQVLTDEKTSPHFARLINEDQNDAVRLGVDSTPFWFIQYPDGKVVYAIADGIRERLKTNEFQKYLDSIPVK